MSIRRAATTIAAALCLIAPVPALAHTVDAPELNVDTTIVTERQLDRAASSSVTPAKRAAAIEEFLDGQSRNGRLVDAQDVNSAVVAEATVVWDEAVDIKALEIAETTSDDVDEADLEIGFESTPVDDQDDTPSTWATGLGLDVTSGLRGGTRVSGSCVTTTVKKDQATTCFAKYKATYSTSAYNYYYYERWGTGTGRPAANGFVAYTPAIIDIRSRPWKGSTAASHTKQLNDYWPRSGSTGCRNMGSASFSSAGLSMTVPLQDCNSTTPIPNATSKTMGVIFDQGTWVDGRSKTASFGFTVAMTKGKVANMADYTYMKFCRPKICLDPSGNLRKDAGW